MLGIAGALLGRTELGQDLGALALSHSVVDHAEECPAKQHDRFVVRELIRRALRREPRVGQRLRRVAGVACRGPMLSEVFDEIEVLRRAALERLGDLAVDPARDGWHSDRRGARPGRAHG